MKNLIALTLIAAALLVSACGNSANKKAQDDQARIDSIANAKAEEAKQELLDSLAKVEEQKAIDAKMDSLEAEVEAAKQEAKQAGAAAAKAQEPKEEPKEEPKQATPSRKGASKRGGGQ